MNLLKSISSCVVSYFKWAIGCQIRNPIIPFNPLYNLSKFDIDNQIHDRAVAEKIIDKALKEIEKVPRSFLQ